MDLYRGGSATNRIHAMAKADYSKLAKWNKHSLSTIMAVWHLSDGGISSAKEINRVLGTKLHHKEVESIIRGASQLVAGPITLEKPVRCCSCGASLLQIPCRLCGNQGVKPARHRGG